MKGKRLFAPIVGGEQRDPAGTIDRHRLKHMLPRVTCNSMRTPAAAPLRGESSSITSYPSKRAHLSANNLHVSKLALAADAGGHAMDTETTQLAPMESYSTGSTLSGGDASVAGLDVALEPVRVEERTVRTTSSNGGSGNISGTAVAANNGSSDFISVAAGRLLENDVDHATARAIDGGGTATIGGCDVQRQMKW